MAITATFSADYTQFIGATKNAEGALTSLTGKTGAVATGLTRVGQAASGAAAPTMNLMGSFRQFDGVLQSLGVHIAPEIKGLEDLAGAAGSSAAEIGLLGTAGLVVGAAIAGWKIGRAAAEILDLDTKVANATAALLGFGDNGAQVAAIRVDELARATATAGHEITNLQVALAINEGSVQRWFTAATQSAGAVAGWDAEIAKLQSHTLKSLQADLDSQNFSLADLAKRYGLTVEALQYFAREQTAAATAVAEAATDYANQQQALAKLAAQWQEVANTQAANFAGAMRDLTTAGQGFQTTLDQLDGETVNAIRYYTDAGVSQADLATAYGLTAGQIRAVVSALGDEKVALDAVAAAEAKVAAAKQAANQKIQDERAAIQPNDKYGLKQKYGQNPSEAFSGLLPIGGGGMTDAAGNSITSITQDIGPGVGPPRTSGGSMTITINAAGLTTAEITRQIEAELVKSAKLKGLVGGTR